MWNCPYSNESFPKYAEDIDAGSSPSVSEMSASAKESGVTLVAGSIPESSNGKLYNTCCVFDDQGKLLAKHRKVSVNLPFLYHLHHHAPPNEHSFLASITLYSSKTDAIATTTTQELVAAPHCYTVKGPAALMQASACLCLLCLCCGSCCIVFALL